MLRLQFLILMAAVTAKVNDKCNDPTGNQIIIFKEEHPGPIGILSKGSGAPIEYCETKTQNTRLLFNDYFLETITHFSRERIPERVVHAKAAGAFGYFEVLYDLSDICEARVFSKTGKKTAVAARFSSTLPELGGSDTTREARGFAIKFYTEHGNFDFVGLNSPVFAIKDPVLFPEFIHALKRNPATHLKDPNMAWDILTLRPESLFEFLILFGDRGIPDGFRHMPGFSIHTYQVVNEMGDSSFVRFHFLPDAGIKNLESDKAQCLAGTDPDYAIRDLYKAIEDENFPCWRLYVQVLSPQDVLNAGFDVFDVTRILPSDKYPLRLVGRLVLNRNPKNYFAEIEQLAFNPANVVPGILGAPDKVFEARRLSYRDAQHHRLGANFFNIPVNCPIRKTYTYNRDGNPPVNDNQKDIPNYYPNSFNGPTPYKAKNLVELVEIHQTDPNNFDQARDLYMYGMTSQERGRTVANIVSSLSLAAKFLQERAVKLYTIIHPDLGCKIQSGLKRNCTF